MPIRHGNGGDEHACQYHTHGKDQEHALEIDIATAEKIQIQGIFVGEENIVQTELEGIVEQAGVKAQLHTEGGHGGGQGGGGCQRGEQEVGGTARNIGEYSRHGAAHTSEEG